MLGGGLFSGMVLFINVLLIHGKKRIVYKTVFAN